MISPPGFVSSLTKSAGTLNGATVFCCTSKVEVPMPGPPAPSPPNTHSESVQAASVAVAPIPSTAPAAARAKTLRRVPPLPPLFFSVEA